MQAMLENAWRQKKIRDLDFHLGLLMERLADRHHAEVRLAATLASAAIEEGNVCQPLDNVPSYWMELEDTPIPNPDDWRNNLLASGVVGHPGELAPLILDEKNRLYLYRYYHYEQQIAENLLQRAIGTLETDTDRASALLARLFPKDDDIEQKLAAAHAILKRLLIISGGAGTGKTFTVTRILALLQSLSPGPLSIALAAPTGKAAARLKESIQEAKQEIPSDLRRNIPDQAKTLHRLLGFRPNANDYIYNEANPLNIDLLIVDEASMIDIAMMSSLLKALPTSARLILLGDHHQLASVESGNLFSDLCDTGKTQWSGEFCAQISLLTGRSIPSSFSRSAHLSDCFSLLEKNYRQDETSGIYALSQAVKHGSMGQARTVLSKVWNDLDVIDQNATKWTDQRNAQILTGYRKMASAKTVGNAFNAMQQFRILCALNDGPFGVSGINDLTEQLLSENELIPRNNTKHYHGKPVIILENHYPLQLFNGDTGILWKDSNDNNRLKAWFKRPDSDELYCLSTGRLPVHDCAYAITIHKSQGSEYEDVLLLLPEDADNRVLSRELLYTGISRAQSRLSVYCKNDVFTTMVKISTDRHSGLFDRLWPD
jgi:exodeoxyribonuclease V alpha subunit